MPRSGLDPSWQSLLVHAWVSGWRWGVDVIDNFGPYGFLYPQQFHPQAAAVMLVLNAILAAVLTVAWLALLRDQSFLVQVLLSVMLLLVIAVRREIFFFAFPFFWC
jgi:hypothetical protein